MTGGGRGVTGGGVPRRKRHYGLEIEVGSNTNGSENQVENSSCHVILAGTLTGVQGDIRCKILAAISTVKYTL